MIPVTHQLDNVMPINIQFREVIGRENNYIRAIEYLDQNGDDSKLLEYYESFANQDPLLIGGGVPEESLYKTVFCKTVAPKIINSIKKALLTNSIPSIELTFEMIDSVRKDLGLKSFGSPQDVLYTFTSDRAPDWGLTLTGMKFQSACMIGEARILVTIAPRFLEVENPDFETNELDGAISSDFWESTKIVGGIAPLCPMLSTILEEIPFKLISNPLLHNWSFEDIQEYLEILQKNDSGKIRCLAKIIKDEMGELKGVELERKWKRDLKKSYKAKASQEQIALKYIEEGKFLQKILGGLTVDHLQSNVKMQKNPLRGNKIEVDSIYRAIGRKKIILVEAKDNSKISKTQLYSIYEAYRLRVPLDWDVIVIAALLFERKNEENNTKQQVIDLIEVKFDDQLLGDIERSLIAIKPKRHFRWNITKMDSERLDY